MEQDSTKVQATEQKDERTVSRRALIKAGWVIPAVMVVGIPKNALAMTGSDYNGGGGGNHDSDSHFSDNHYSWNYSSNWLSSLIQRIQYRWSWWGW